MGDTQTASKFDELNSLYENLGEWDGLRIDAYANGDMGFHRKARAMCDDIEARICELEDELEPVLKLDS